jgi:hypothetical protein
MITTANAEHIEALKEAYKINGGKWGRFNLFGIRNPADQDKDIFNDVIGAATNDIMILMQGTTDPGKRGTEKSVKGVCHMIEGFHDNAWALGWHGGKDKAWRHEAFIQVASVPYWRDKDRDYELSGKDQIITGEPASGINIHSTTGKPEEIGGWSIGCQVVRDMAEFKNILKIAKTRGPLYSYMLFSLKKEVDLLYKLVYGG